MVIIFAAPLKGIDYVYLINFSPKMSIERIRDCILKIAERLLNPQHPGMGTGAVKNWIEPVAIP
jgi:hypothetical protein